MPPLSIMLKPASSLCNLNCDYCFYHSLAASREVESHGIMSIELFGDVFSKALNFTSGKPLMISFQGGEPLIAGKDFFKSVLKVAKTLNKKSAPVFFGLQTNGTLIDEEWCEIFKTGNFLVGLSLDGDAATNDYRKDKDGENSFEKVMHAATLLKKHRVEFNILTVLTKRVANNIEKIYSFFKSNRFRHLQFIPCLKPLASECASDNKMFDDNMGQFDSDFYLSAADYERFLFECFKLYLADIKNNDYTSIRYFDNLAALACGRPAEQCGMNGHCTHQFVIESDGETYPCDFYCLDKFSLGNVAKTDFAELSHHPVAVSFIKDSLAVEEKCKTCRYFALCKNGCKRERMDVDKCEATKKFLNYSLPYLRKLS